MTSIVRISIELRLHDVNNTLHKYGHVNLKTEDLETLGFTKAPKHKNINPEVRDPNPAREQMKCASKTNLGS